MDSQTRLYVFVITSSILPVLHWTIDSLQFSQRHVRCIIHNNIFLLQVIIMALLYTWYVCTMYMCVLRWKQFVLHVY